MAYLSLYRRCRPLSFTEMTGQEHVSRTLSHALAQGRLAHAYLFCGPRGTGKTTTAKILARAVNCHRFPAPEPCGECPPCRNIAAGVSLDVIEMDAASTRGIDEIRELRERTRYASSESRYKVYILDEAHMLTTEACNAFLKTLEEPPPGVIFILATTDPSRLPATIVSRCQRFDFHLLTVEQIRGHLAVIAEREGWTVEEEALRLIARLAEGSLRDALGLLEQCRSYGDEMITAEHVRSVTGVTRAEIIGALIGALAKENLAAALAVLQQVTYSGRDLALFLRDLTFFFSRLLLEGAGTAGEEGYYGFAELLEQCRGKFSRPALLEVIELLHEAGGELRQAHYPQFVLEVTLIRILRVLHYGGEKRREVEVAPPVSRREDSSVPEKRSRVVRADAAESAGELPGEEEPPVPDLPPEAGVESGEAVPRAAAETAAARAAPEPAEEADFNRQWTLILKEIKRKQASTYWNLMEAQECALRGNLLILGYQKENYAAARIMEEGHRRLVENVVTRRYARTIRIKIKWLDPDAAEKYPPPAEDCDAVHDAPEDPGGEKDGENGAAAEDKTYEFSEIMKLFPGQVVDIREEGGSGR